MSLEWDYAPFAATYRERPPYDEAAFDAIVEVADAIPGDAACDVGAGDGRATMPLLERGLRVTAVEPCAAMRGLGLARTRGRREVRWVAACAEATALAAERFRLVTFGSSFNVVHRARALSETARILGPDGWIACLFQYRRLEDPLQAEIEAAIRRIVPDWDGGVRRVDQSRFLAESGLFGPVLRFETGTVRAVDPAGWLDAWRSHATLARAAGVARDSVLDAIRRVVEDAARPLLVPYETRVWMAPRARFVS